MEESRVSIRIGHLRYVYVPSVARWYRERLSAASYWCDRMWVTAPSRGRASKPGQH